MELIPNIPAWVILLVPAVMVLIDQIVAVTPTDKDNRIWGPVSDIIRFILFPSKGKNGKIHTENNIWKGKKDKADEEKTDSEK